MLPSFSLICSHGEYDNTILFLKLCYFPRFYKDVYPSITLTYRRKSLGLLVRSVLTLHSHAQHIHSSMFIDYRAYRAYIKFIKSLSKGLLEKYLYVIIYLKSHANNFPGES